MKKYPVGTIVKSSAYEKYAIGYIAGYDSIGSVEVRRFDGGYSVYAGGVRKASLADIKRTKERLSGATV